MKTVYRLIYPPQCISCDTMVDDDLTLCGSCWSDTPFIGGNICDKCGTPLPGAGSPNPEFCDDCMTIARPWVQGRAALLYEGNARSLVLALKHGDRQELAKPAAGWMTNAARGLFRPNMLVVPVPVHWRRLLSRRYNQAGLLAQGIGRLQNLECIPDALSRHRPTPVQDGMGTEARFQNIANAIVPHNKHGVRLKGKDVLLVDDVMTSGATLAASTDACHAAGANQVFVLALARVAKDA